MVHSAFIMQYSTNCKIIFRLFIPHIGSFYSPMWSFQRHNSYRVAMPHSAFIMQYSTNCKTIFHRYENAEAVSGSFYTLIYSPRSSFHSPTWGYQKHNSYRVAMPHNVFVMQYYTNYADNFCLFNPHVGSFHSPMWGFQRQNSYRVAMLYSAICDVI